MNFRLQPGQHLGEEVRRIAGHQIDGALAELKAPDDRHEAIHDVRKRFKKLRALLRLVRAGDASFYRTENARYRDAARELSAVRDRTALIESLDALEKHVEHEVATDAFGPIRAALERKRDAAIEKAGDLHETIAAILASLEDSRDAVGVLAFRQPVKAAPRILAGGFGRTYRDGRSALKDAAKSGSSEDFHILRKHAKYHAAHLGLLAELWPEGLKPARDAATAIGDDLGQDHDYAVFRAEAEADPAAFGERRHLDVVLALMDRRQADLRAASLKAARRLFAEKPKAAKARVLALFAEAARRGAPVRAPAEQPEEMLLRAAE